MTPGYRPRVDELRSAKLVSVPGLTGALADRLFDSPATAVTALTKEFHAVWARRSDRVDDRPVGSLHLGSGAYVQWIGYGHRLVVEVSSNRYLRPDIRLSLEEQECLLRYGFRRPHEGSPNFSATAGGTGDAPRLAMAVVAALTGVFGVYVG